MIDGTCIRYDAKLACYVVLEMSWEVNEKGIRIPHSLHEELFGYLSTKEEMKSGYLPAVCLNKAKWDLPADRPKLRPQMFESPLGLKEIALKASR